MPAVQKIIERVIGQKYNFFYLKTYFLNIILEKKFLGIKPKLTINPDEAVSLGAAVMAGTLDGVLSNMQVMSSWQAALFRTFYENYNSTTEFIESSQIIEPDLKVLKPTEEKISLNNYFKRNSKK